MSRMGVLKESVVHNRRHREGEILNDYFGADLESISVKHKSGVCVFLEGGGKPCGEAQERKKI